MRCFAVLGPSSSGKSALVDRLCALEDGAKRSAVSASYGLAQFRFLDEDWCAIDCPGSIEALPEARTALLAADAAVICVPPDPEQAVLAAPYFRLVEEAATPTLVFINRMDEAEARARDVVAALQGYARQVIVLRQIPIREGEQVVGAVDLVSERAWRYREGQPSALIEIPDEAFDREQEARTELLESLSDHDDWLLEQLIEDREPAEGPIYGICTRVLQESQLIPALLGSAEHANGIMRLMKALRHEAPQVAVLRARLAAQQPEPGPEPLAVVFQAAFRKHLGKVLYLRSLGEGVGQGAVLGGATLGGVMEIGSDKAAGQGAIAPGTVVAAVKSDHLSAGHLYTGDKALAPPSWARSPTPMLARLLVPEQERDEVKLSTTLTRLGEEDPGLSVGQDADSGAALVRVQGPMHLRRLIETLSETFAIPVVEHGVGDVYRETITRQADVHYRHRKQTGGAGQFADVKLTVRPNPRGAGFTFDETIKGGTVPRNYIPAVEAGAEDATARGPLGFPVVDIGVTLTDGQYHSVDSSDFAFRTAARMGVQQGLGEAAPVLLQPIHKVEIHVPSVFSGALVPSVSSLKGHVRGFKRDTDAKGWDIFRALMPASVLDELVHTLRSATQGIGHFDSVFDHYEELYGKEADKISKERLEAKA